MQFRRSRITRKLLKFGPPMRLQWLLSRSFGKIQWRIVTVNVLFPLGYVFKRPTTKSRRLFERNWKFPTHDWLPTDSNILQRMMTCKWRGKELVDKSHSDSAGGSIINWLVTGVKTHWQIGESAYSGKEPCLQRLRTYYVSGIRGYLSQLSARCRSMQILYRERSDTLKIGN